MGKQKEKKDKQRNRRRPGATAPSAEDQEVDAEMAAQVKEIEERLQVLTKELRSVEASIRNCTVEAKRAQLTTKELEPLNDDAKIYRQVGRMWIRQPKADIANSLQATTALKSVESQQLKQAHVKLEVKMKGEADGLRELLGPERMKALAGGTLFNRGTTGTTSTTGTGTTAAIPEEAPPSDGLIPIFGRPAPPTTSAASSGAAATTGAMEESASAGPEATTEDAKKGEEEGQRHLQ